MYYIDSLKLKLVDSQNREDAVSKSDAGYDLFLPNK
jgi:hypothetical protein